jgi:hypothetical protein
MVPPGRRFKHYRPPAIRDFHASHVRAYPSAIFELFLCCGDIATDYAKDRTESGQNNDDQDDLRSALT